MTSVLYKSWTIQMVYPYSDYRLGMKNNSLISQDFTNTIIHSKILRNENRIMIQRLSTTMIVVFTISMHNQIFIIMMPIVVTVMYMILMQSCEAEYGYDCNKC